jgi:hypothetical protein
MRLFVDFKSLFSSMRAGESNLEKRTGAPFFFLPCAGG